MKKQNNVELKKVGEHEKSNSVPCTFLRFLKMNDCKIFSKDNEKIEYLAKIYNQL